MSMPFKAQGTGALSLSIALAMLAGCSPDRNGDTGQSPSAGPAAGSRMAEAAAASAEAAGAESASEVPEFPIIPTIVVPQILGVTPAQQALEASLQSVLDPMEGITVSPARCDTGGSLINGAGITRMDEQGTLTRNSEEGLFKINADGSGTANFEGGLIEVNADGSGTINGPAAGNGGDSAIIRVQADGSGTYNGPAGLIQLDGQGGGTWNGDKGLITNTGDGGGTWNGPMGLIRVNPDGSGTWNSDAGLIVNNGDGTGTIGPPARPVKMPRMPRLPPAGKFPPLKKFAPPGAPCGYLITLNDRVLFDFDKATIRADAAQLLDTLASALARVKDSRMEVRGHTDSKGEDAYNQQLSERRAQAVQAALRERGTTQQMDARGFGEREPVAPNELEGKDNPSGRQLNRRVEIFVRT
jgi:OOP family OmpA-OmpF porin